MARPDWPCSLERIRKRSTSADSRTTSSGKAHIYQGGGNEVVVESVPESVRQAIEAALKRLFPRFPDADQAGWDRVVRRATEGAADPMSVLGYQSDVEKHPVCQEVRGFVGGAGKKGAEVRRHFSASPFGWPQDAVDGALLALLAGGFLRAVRNGEPAPARGMNQQQIRATDFFSEGVVVTVRQRIEVRRVASGMGLTVMSGEEAQAVPILLARLADEAQSAGGQAPLPAPPDATLVRRLRENLAGGNQQIVDVAENTDALLAFYRDWTEAAETARQRLPEWQRLETLLRHARDLSVSADLKPQVDTIRSDRSLLSEPNPLPPLLGQVTTAVRKAVSDAHGRLVSERDHEVADLEAWDNWSKLKESDRARILESNRLGPVPGLDIGSDHALIECLAETALEGWNDRILALKARVEQAREEAALLLAPKAVRVRPPAATLNSREEVEAYVQQLKDKLLAQVDERPVIIS